MLNNGRLQIVLEPAEDIPGQWTAHRLDIDLVTQGNSAAHALEMIVDASEAMGNPIDAHGTRGVACGHRCPMCAVDKMFLPLGGGGHAPLHVEAAGACTHARTWPVRWRRGYSTTSLGYVCRSCGADRVCGDTQWYSIDQVWSSSVHVEPLAPHPLALAWECDHTC